MDGDDQAPSGSRPRPRSAARKTFGNLNWLQQEALSAWTTAPGYCHVPPFGSDCFALLLVNNGSPLCSLRWGDQAVLTAVVQRRRRRRGGGGGGSERDC
ncbi:unnamed protein product [Lampetra planeri]